MSYVEPSANVTQKILNPGGASSTTASLNSVVIGAAYNVVQAGTAQSQVAQIAAIANPNAPVVYQSAASGYTFNDHVSPGATGVGAGWNDPPAGHFQMALPAAIAGQKVTDGSFELVFKNAQVRQNVLLLDSVRHSFLAGIEGNTANEVNHAMALVIDVTSAAIPSDGGGSGVDGKLLAGDYWKVGTGTEVAPWTGHAGEYLVFQPVTVDGIYTIADFLFVETEAEAKDYAHRIRLSASGQPLPFDDTWAKLAGITFVPDGTGTGGAYSPDANGYDGAPSTLEGDLIKYSVWYCTYRVAVTTRVSYEDLAATVPAGAGISGVSTATGVVSDTAPTTHTATIRDLKKDATHWYVRSTSKVLADAAVQDDTTVDDVVVRSHTHRGVLPVTASSATGLPVNSAQAGDYWTVTGGGFTLGSVGNTAVVTDGDVVLAIATNPRDDEADWEVFASLALAQAEHPTWTMRSHGELVVTAAAPFPVITPAKRDYWTISATATFDLGASPAVSVSNGSIIVATGNTLPSQDGDNWTPYASLAAANAALTLTIDTTRHYVIRTALTGGSANALENDDVTMDVYRVLPTLTIPLDQTPSAEAMPWILTKDSNGFVQEVDKTTNPSDGQNKLTLSSNYLNTEDATASGFVTIPYNFHSVGRSNADGVNTLYGLINDVPAPSAWALSILRYADAVYLGYRALRTDLSNRLLSWNTSTAIDAQFGYIGEENPLGLAAQVAYTATGGTGVPIYGYAVDSDDMEGHVGALDYLATRRDVHCFGVMNRSPAIATVYKAHVDGMSTPSENSWRLAVVNIAYPTKQYLAGGDITDELEAGFVYQVASNNLVGLPQYNSTSYTTRIVDQNVDFLSSAISPNDIVEIPNFAIPDGSALPSGTVPSSFIGLWQVAEVIDAHTLKVTPFGGTTYPSSYTGNLANRPTGAVPTSSTAFVPYSIYRQASKDYQIQYLKAFSTTLKDRRMWHIQPDEATIEIGGTPTQVSGMYLVAEHVGVCAASRPQQNFTRMATVGISDIAHSNFYFSRTQMRDLASAGICFMVQKVPEGVPYVSHALTTDVTALFYQEQMKTRNLDFLAYTFLDVMDPFVGKWNQTAGLYTTARTVLQGKAKLLMGQTDTIIGPPLLGFKIKTMEQSTVNPDRMIVVLSCAIVDPTNYIDITLEV